MSSLSQEAIILALQKSVVETMLSNPKYQKTGVPQRLVKSILSILTSDRPKSYLIWGTSIKEKQFLYGVYNTIFNNTPELNPFLASTSLSEKREYGLKAARELEKNIHASTTTIDLSQYLEELLSALANMQEAPPSHW